MIYLNQVHEKREETAKNILSIYSNKDSLVTKELSVEDFQKSYPTEEFNVITNDILKSYSQKIVEDINSTKDIAEREAIVKSSAEEINAYTGINVKSENGAIKRFYVKKKEDNIEKSEKFNKEDYDIKYNNKKDTGHTANIVEAVNKKTKESHTYYEDGHNKGYEYYKGENYGGSGRSYSRNYKNGEGAPSKYKEIHEHLKNLHKEYYNKES